MSHVMLVGTIRTVGVVWTVGVGVLMPYAFVMVALNGMVMTVDNRHGSDDRDCWGWVCSGFGAVLFV